MSDRAGSVAGIVGVVLAALALIMAVYVYWMGRRRTDGSRRQAVYDPWIRYGLLIFGLLAVASVGSWVGASSAGADPSVLVTTITMIPPTLAAIAAIVTALVGARALRKKDSKKDPGVAPINHVSGNMYHIYLGDESGGNGRAFELADGNLRIDDRGESIADPPLQASVSDTVEVPAAGPRQPSLTAEITQLFSLHDSGALSKEEFERAKRIAFEAHGTMVSAGTALPGDADKPRELQQRPAEKPALDTGDSAGA
ncbi:SHOCT domain-containing protein [Actinoplanes sp. NPDC049265]|uniref:SHOCT domain-containing protein n=1 Tax=Actinoplanes sp. NPDC049265 TaxID=3363902 RepID=UPI00371C13AF